MSKFIELTDADYNNTKFLVNVDTIRDIYPMDTGCAIMFAHRGMTTHVAESYETVKAMMDDYINKRLKNGSNDM